MPAAFSKRIFTWQLVAMAEVLGPPKVGTPTSRGPATSSLQINLQEKIALQSATGTSHPLIAPAKWNTFCRAAHPQSVVVFRRGC
jgi:hypothetical protein